MKPMSKSTMAERKAQAEKRQAKYDELTILQKIELCKNRPGNSKKELSKLTTKLTKEK